MPDRVGVDLITAGCGLRSLVPSSRQSIKDMLAVTSRVNRPACYRCSPDVVVHDELV
jgi:hypothetical protein